MKKSKKSRPFVLIISILALFSPLLYASATWDPNTSLAAEDISADDLFGYSVAIDGEYAIVGAYKNPISQDNGAAYIFKYNPANGTWVQQDKLTPDDSAANDRFGYSVDIYGDYAIIGATHNGGNYKGAAYIFTRSGTSWSQTQKLIPDDLNDLDKIGTSVSISSNYAVIGAPNSDPAGSDSGSAYVYKLEGSTWTNNAKLEASDGASGDLFGWSVSTSGDFIIIGAWGDDDYGSNSGSAYVFYNNGIEWIEHTKLNIPDAAANDKMGYSVSISGNYAISGSYGQYGTGSADIFEYDSTNWQHHSKLIASDASINDSFGKSVCIDLNRAIIGAPEKDINTTNSGAAYIYELNGASWNEMGKITSLTPADNDNLGISVTISSNLAVAGTPYRDHSGVDSGLAYVFKRNVVCPTADLTDDCFVDIADFAVLASQWMTGERAS